MADIPFICPDQECRKFGCGRKVKHYHNIKGVECPILAEEKCPKCEKDK